MLRIFALFFFLPSASVTLQISKQNTNQSTMGMKILTVEALTFDNGRRPRCE